MNSKTWTRIIALAFFAALAVPVQLAAQDNAGQGQKPKHHRYNLIDLGTFGGPKSGLSGPGVKPLTNRGTFVGGADTSVPNPNSQVSNPYFTGQDTFVQHAFRWQHGVKTDLGALPGVNNSYTNSVNESGLIVGISENGLIDPLTGFQQVDGILWKNGQLTDLGTLGGNQTLPVGVNHREQVAGFAQNSIPDTFPIIGGMVTQTRAFLWENGVMHDLGTLGGPDAAAYAMNERGQVAGAAYTNSIANSTTGIPTQDPFLWEEGKMVDLGTLGGTFGYPNTLNNRGQVIGQSNLAGDGVSHPFLWDTREGLKDLGTLGGDNGVAWWINEEGAVVGKADLPGSQSYHAFLWEHGVMTDLGVPAGEECSIAYGINSKRQVVGESSGPCNGNGEVWLWENGGPPVNLDTLFLHVSNLFMYDAWYINERGEIPGTAYSADTGEIHAVLLVPQGDCDDDCEARIAASQHDEIAVNGIDANGNEKAALPVPCDENHGGVHGCDYTLVDASGGTLENSAPAMRQPTAPTPRTLRPFGRRGSSSRDSGTQTSTLPNVENDSPVPADGTANDPTPDDTGSLLGTVTRAPPLLRENLGTLGGTRVAGRCVRRGGQCPFWTKCCPGLKCVPASTRAFCEP